MPHVVGKYFWLLFTYLAQLTKFSNLLYLILPILDNSLIFQRITNFEYFKKIKVKKLVSSKYLKKIGLKKLLVLGISKP
jgi:hypothetical protein